jgi:hypothetical protein
MRRGCPNSSRAAVLVNVWLCRDHAVCWHMICGRIRRVSFRFGFLEGLTLRYGRARPGINPEILSFAGFLVEEPPETNRILE